MNPTGSIRPLQYPLNLTEDMESSTPTDTIDIQTLDGWVTTDNEERVDIVLNLSLYEYVALATTIDVGRDIAYGDNSIYIWWIWVRALKSMSLCDSIIACIEDPNSGVSEAINSVVTIENFEDSVAVAQTTNNTSLGDGANPLCDNDILFGQAKQMVDYLDTINVDALEILEALSNIQEFVAEVIGDITIIDETSIDAFLAWGVKLQDNIAENYVAQVTVAYKDTIACEIFCRAQQQNCAITPTLLFDIFKDRLNATVTIESLIENSLNYLVGGAWTGTEIADFMFFSQFAIRSQVGRFLGRSVYNDIDLRLRIFANDPDPDWTLLCSCDCVEVTEVWDFTSDSHNTVFSIRQSTATVYVAGVGYQGNSPGGAQIWTNRYSSISEVTGISTAVGATPLLRLDNFDAETGGGISLIGFVPWTGDEDLAEELLVVGYGNSGWTQGTIEQVTITGCLR